jgi:hypothetical protein
MGLKQQALYLAPPGLLLRLNLVKCELEGARGRQPSLQGCELEGRGSADGGGGMSLRLKAREWSGVARRQCRRQKWRCDICC